MKSPLYKRAKSHYWRESHYWVSCSWWILISGLVFASWLPPRHESGNRFKCCEGPNFKGPGLCVMECTASNTEGKGPTGKPMVICFLTHVIITIASFPFSVVSLRFFDTPAHRLTYFMAPGSPPDSGGRKRNICVMKRVIALWDLFYFPFLIQALAYHCVFPERSKIKSSWLWSSKK